MTRRDYHRAGAFTIVGVLGSAAVALAGFFLPLVTIHAEAWTSAQLADSRAGHLWMFPFGVLLSGALVLNASGASGARSRQRNLRAFSAAFALSVINVCPVIYAYLRAAISAHAAAVSVEPGSGLAVMLVASLTLALFTWKAGRKASLS